MRGTSRPTVWVKRQRRYITEGVRAAVTGHHVTQAECNMVYSGLLEYHHTSTGPGTRQPRLESSRSRPEAALTDAWEHRRRGKRSSSGPQKE